jgi:uncharacterized protein (TIGR03437 family)
MRSSLIFVKVRFWLSISALLASTLVAQQAFIPSVIGTPGSPSKVLYGTYNGAFLRSGDLGSTWTPVYLTEAGLPQPPILGIVFDVADPKTVYVSTNSESGGVWRSNDDGLTWAKANSGLPASGPVMDLREIANVPPLLFVRVANQLYRSDNQGGSWVSQGLMPSTSGALAISDAPLNTMYYIDALTLNTYRSVDFGHSWPLLGNVPTPPADGMVVYASLLANTSDVVFVSVISPTIGSGAYFSNGGGGLFVEESGAGLGLFSKIDSAAGQTDYAFGYQGTGFYRSDDNGQTWRGIGLAGSAAPFSLGAVDPANRLTIYAVRGGSFPGLVKSTDGGVNWNAIAATIKPTLAKPASALNLTLEEAAPYSQSFKVQTVEDATLGIPFTISTSGETWLKLDTTSGTTPVANTININTGGLAPGTYHSSIKISSPQAFNQSVTIPVQLTIVPAGTAGPQYTVATFAGNGNASGPILNGAPTGIAIGAPKALAFDNSGKLLISSGNRIWQVSNGSISVLAGSGAFASTGDGADAQQAALADPDDILVDSQGTIYFTEFSTGRVRKIVNGGISTVLDLSRANIQPTHAVLIDSFGRLLMANTTGLLRYDGNKVQTLTPYPFRDPYAMIQDPAGNIYVADRGLHQILKFPVSGPISIVAGLPSPGFGGDGGPATQAILNTPSGLAMDAQGTLYLADTGNQRIRTITADGLIHTVAGSGLRGFDGDGKTADFAAFQSPMAVALDSKGVLYVADNGNNRVRSLAFAPVPPAKPTAVIHAASGSPQIAPGGLFSIYGTQLALLTAQTTTATWPKLLGGVSVTINGIPAPIYYASAGLINGQVPYEVQPGTATVVVTISGAQPAQISAQVVAANPGLLLFEGRALVVNPDGTVNTPSNGAPAGNFAILYLSGIGIPDHPVATGAPAPSTEPFARVAYPSNITVGGQSVNVLYLGLAPGYPALAQANIIVPTLPPGSYPVVVTINGVPSNSANIVIK